MPRPSLHWIVLIIAVAGEALVLYFLEDRLSRLGLGLLAVAAVLWASARLATRDLLERLKAERTHRRRFVRLRTHVQQLLNEVRRLNWLAVDADRGFRSKEAATEEMDAIEGRLRDLVAAIREAAGEAAPEGVEAPPDAEGSDRPTEPEYR